MKIMADRNMPFAEQAFATLGDVTLNDGRSLTNADVRDADLLAVRSTTKVNAALLEGSRVRFVGTATIGTDHMDIDYLESKGIAWCYSPGCNANSVSEYVTAALLHLAAERGFSLAGKTLGVIGVGNVGKRVVEKGLALGLRVLKVDPPRRREAETAGDLAGAAEFLPLSEVLTQSDIITLHVPLSSEGEDATRHMADASFFSALKKGAVFINAARGPIQDTAALISALRSGQLSHAIIDTWEGEPDYDETLLELVAIGTPHIAGHSFEGKAFGTEMVYRAACQALGLEPRWSLEAHLPSPPVPHIRLDRQPDGPRDIALLHAVIRQLYDISSDDHRMRERMPDAPLHVHFDTMRKTYPMRREFRFTRVEATHDAQAFLTQLRQLGFQTA